MELTEKTVSKNYVYRGKIITVRADDALRPRIPTRGNFSRRSLCPRRR